MSFDEFKAAVLERWPAHRWYFQDGHGCFLAAGIGALRISWREEIGWCVHRCIEGHGATLPAAIRNARNAINRAAKALDKEPK